MIYDTKHTFYFLKIKNVHISIDKTLFIILNEMINKKKNEKATSINFTVHNSVKRIMSNEPTKWI